MIPTSNTARFKGTRPIWLFIAWLAAATSPSFAQSHSLLEGHLFEGHADVGTVLHAGSAAWDAASESYTLTGSGTNMWFGEDDFHFAWKKVAGDVTLSAALSFPSAGGDPHRKAVLMIRQSLDLDSAYAGAALHGDGLTSLQFRAARGEATHEIRSNGSAPRRLRIEKRGDLFYLSVAGPQEELRFMGGSVRVPLTGTFYVGIGVCAHNKDDIQTAVFTDVSLSTGAHPKPAEYSTLETIDIASTDALAVYVKPGSMESPAWSHDGSTLTFRSAGERYAVPAAGGEADRIASPGGDDPTSPNSPDGKWIASFSNVNGETALSVTSSSDKKVKVLARFDSGADSPDALAWSPDSRRIAFVSRQRY